MQSNCTIFICIQLEIPFCKHISLIDTNSFSAHLIFLGFNFNSDDVADIGAKTLAYHRIVEAFKFAYGKRSALGDEEYEDVEGVRPSPPLPTSHPHPTVPPFTHMD